jgi:hypothetical protein
LMPSLLRCNTMTERIQNTVDKDLCISGETDTVSAIHSEHLLIPGISSPAFLDNASLLIFIDIIDL